MREVFTDQDFTRVGYFKSILEEAGIAAMIRNENSHNSLSGMPSALFFPTLCVINDEDYDAAVELLKPHYEEPVVDASGADWICPACHESNPSTFGSCWKCEMARPAD